MKRICACFFCLLLLAFSCKKKKDATVADQPTANTELQSGLPDNRTTINGYLFASKVFYFNTESYLYCHAEFSDPATDIMIGYDHYRNQSRKIFGNVNTGAVKFGMYTLANISTGTNLFYRLQGATLLTGDFNDPKWETDGNNTFKPLNLELKRGFPVILNGSRTFTASMSQDYTLSFDNFISNYDSVVVSITNKNNVSVTKRVSHERAVSFTKAELYGLSYQFGGACYLTLFTYNYSYKIVNGKCYVFELGAELESNITIGL